MARTGQEGEFRDAQEAITTTILFEGELYCPQTKPNNSLDFMFYDIVAKIDTSTKQIRSFGAHVHDIGPGAWKSNGRDP